MQRPRPPPVYAPAHEVVLPEMHGLGRAWYGRMYFPPREARLTKAARADLTAQEGALHASVNMSFGEMREQTYDAYFTGRPEAALALGCHASRRQLQDEQSCSGEMPARAARAQSCEYAGTPRTLLWLRCCMSAVACILTLLDLVLPRVSWWPMFTHFAVCVWRKSENNISLLLLPYTY